MLGPVQILSLVFYNCKLVHQIEALLRRINEENKKTKEVLETIQRNELRKELKVIRKLAMSPNTINKQGPIQLNFAVYLLTIRPLRLNSYWHL